MVDVLRYQVYSDGEPLSRDMVLTIPLAWLFAPFPRVQGGRPSSGEAGVTIGTTNSASSSFVGFVTKPGTSAM